MATQTAAAAVLRTMTADDIEAACELSREQSWPHREEDWALFLSLGQGIVAELDGRIVGSIMGWCFGAAAATIGLVIVSPAMQGRGLGRQLMEQMMARLGDRSILLNATDEGAPLYRKLGFVECGTVYQHQAVAGPVPLAELRPGERVRPTGGADDMLDDLYSRASGMDRSGLLEALSSDAQTVVLTRDHVPTGFAQFRRFGRGWQVGPVVAPDTAGAKALVLHWLATGAGSFCRLDVTEASGLSGWLDELGLPCVGRVKTMVRGTPPQTVPNLAVQALAAQALG